MGDDEEVEAAGLYTGLCSTSTDTTESGFSSASAEEEKHSCRKVFDTELHSGGAVCTLALQEDDHLDGSIRSRCAQYPVHSPSGSSA